jgi:hypothetical protein
LTKSPDCSIYVLCGATPFPTRFYGYGDGGWFISVSDALLEHYKAQGFSKRSLCMALVSGIRFNPETGSRLATYIIIYDQKALKQGQGESGLSDELPLAIPRCFRNGTRYTDCAMNHDPISGKRLTAERTRYFRDLGERIARRLGASEVRNAFHYIEYEGYIGVGAMQKELLDGPRPAHLSFYDYSSEFPKGFGYALYADGGAAPTVSAEVVRAALEGRSRPRAQIDAGRLRELLSNN